MEIRSQSKYVRTTPRKARLIARSIRHLPLDKALTTLDRLNKKAALLIKKTIESGIANAENNAKVSRDSLDIKALYIDEGPRFKRWRAASRGMAHAYSKNTSHITVILASDENKSKAETTKKGKKTETKKDDKLKQSAEKKPQKQPLGTGKKYDTKMKDEQQMKSQKQTTKGVTPRKVIGN